VQRENPAAVASQKVLKHPYFGCLGATKKACDNRPLVRRRLANSMNAPIVGFLILLFALYVGDTVVAGA
jgi:hypothetical protein